jgi:hypothetical protein
VLRLLKSIFLFVAIVVAVLAAPILFVTDNGDGIPQNETGLPWQIDILPDGFSRVIGLTPGVSMLENAEVKLGAEAQVAMIVAPGESGSLEAYFDTVKLGFVSGKLILTLETTLEGREGMLKRAVKAEYMESTTRRVMLADSDIRSLKAAKISAISFIPSAQLDEVVVLQRFGVPGERIKSSEHTEHFLYPEKGLDLRLDSKGKELLQYVAPRDFSRLRDPLLEAAK